MEQGALCRRAQMPGRSAMSVYKDLLARADNLERYPFESATMAEAGKLAAKHLREVARDMGDGSTSFRNAVLVIAEGEDSDAVKVRRIWKMAAQESALPHLHMKPPVSVGGAETCTHKAKYDELIYAVAQKHEGESRHDTALRYIQERESAHGIETALANAGHSITILRELPKGDG